MNTQPKFNSFGELMLRCPVCVSSEIIITEEQMFEANTGHHYCHSVKFQDSDAKAKCLHCGWEGQRFQLEQGE